MLKQEIEIILKDQEKYFTDETGFINRTLQDEIRTDIPMAIIISGVRRSGKSTLLKNLYKQKGEKAGYLHFDDPRLNDFDVTDFYKVEELWQDKEVFQFDEIHKVKRWEEYVRQALERKMRIGITGSNAMLLSKELGTLLTGRHITYELFPFSYNEYLEFIGDHSSYSTFEKYFREGGFPEAILYKIPGYHTTLLQNILQRDIAIRFGIKHYSNLNRVALHLINNCSRLASYSGIAKHYHIASVKTVSDYISMLMDVYLVFAVPVFSYSYKKQVNNPKKTYIIDHAFARENSTKLFDDYGRLLENMVFISLRRKYENIYYYKDRYECDFLVNKNGSFEVFQACWEVNTDNKDREINGLKEPMRKFSLTSGTIVTANQEDILTVDEGTIKLIPFWKWDTARL